MDQTLSMGAATLERLAAPLPPAMRVSTKLAIEVCQPHQWDHLSRLLLHLLRQLLVPRDEVPQIHLERVVMHEQRASQSIPVDEAAILDAKAHDERLELTLELGRGIGVHIWLDNGPDGPNA